VAERDRIQRLEYDIAMVSRQIAGLPVRIGDSHSSSENFRLIRGQSVGIQSGATIDIDNVVVLSGGLDPSGGNPATTVKVANLFGQSFTDNEAVQAIYSPGVSSSPVANWEAIKTTSGTEMYRLIRGLVKGDVTADDTTFVIDNVIPLAGGLDPVTGNAATEITVQQSPHDRFTVALEDNSPITAIYDGANWELLEVERYRWIRGKAAGTVATTDDTFHVDNIFVLSSGCDPRTDPTSTVETVEVTNLFDQAYDNDATVIAVYNTVLNIWEAIPTVQTPDPTELFVCTLSGTISAGSTSNMGVGTGTVYSIGNGSALTSVGSRTIHNPYLSTLPATAAGSQTILYTCVKTWDDPSDADDEFTITGIDWLRLLTTLSGFGQHKILWASDAATPTAGDIEWAGQECDTGA
jgi:hypothetical protein